jgi:hypothetical protein
MSQDPVRTYLDAKAKLDEAEAKIRGIHDLIADVGQRLLHPYEFMISNIDVGFPAEVVVGRTQTLDANKWPSAKQIAENLAALHMAYQQAQDAWERLSSSDRANMTPFPEKK